MRRVLDGVGVLITRPVELAAALVQGVEQAGGRAILFPALQITAVPATEMAAQLRSLRDANDVIFVSPTAVRVGAPLLASLGPPSVARRCFAVGAGTARELKNLCAQPIITPERGADSEALLRLPQLLQVKGRRVAIIRGEGGRELLRETLQARGADVSVVECYRRGKPVRELPISFENDVAAVTATSSEIVTNLFSIGGRQTEAWLKRRPFFVTHPRIARRAAQCGVLTVCVGQADDAAGADAALVAALRTWFADLSVEQSHIS